MIEKYHQDIFLFLTVHIFTQASQILSLSLILLLLTWRHGGMFSGNLGGKLMLTKRKISPILSWQTYAFMPMGSKAMGCVPQLFGHIQA